MLTRIDYVVIVLYAGVVAVLGWIAKSKIKTLDDYFAGGHRLPWWVGAISHHVSGYSAVVFVGFAGIAYSAGFSIWTLFALPTFLAMMIGAFVWAPRWARLRVSTAVEYLELRFNNRVRQVIAWSGIGVKFIDEGVKLYALSVVVNVCTGWPIGWVIVGTGIVTILYVLVGGLWATALTDVAQFIIQTIFILLLVPLVLSAVGGWDALWEQLPDDRAGFFSSTIPPHFVFVFFFVVVLSYNGGTWGLAQRFYSIGKASGARKAALLSGVLYLIYPLAVFIPAWAGPLLLEQVSSPEHVYILVAQKMLSGVAPGLVGLLVISMFAATMSMIDSDLNALAAVFTKDIYHVTFAPQSTDTRLLRVGLIATIVLGLLTIVSALIVWSNPAADRAFKVTVEWFTALLGPVTIPLLFGMLFRRTTWRGALGSLVAGFLTFAVLRVAFHDFAPPHRFAICTGGELLAAFLVFFGEGFLSRQTDDEKKRVSKLFDRLRP